MARLMTLTNFQKVPSEALDYNHPTGLHQDRMRRSENVVDGTLTLIVRNTAQISLINHQWKVRACHTLIFLRPGKDLKVNRQMDICLSILSVRDSRSGRWQWHAFSLSYKRRLRDKVLLTHRLRTTHAVPTGCDVM